LASLAACRLACVQALRTVVRSGILIIDSDGEVLEKYHRYLTHRGQPGVGDAFFKHVIDHQFNTNKVRCIPLERHEEREFNAFPADPALATFDRSDRIFVALAIVAPGKPHILNAVDSDYYENKAALEKARVQVQELCPNCIRQR
jgi:hypothetical protein